MSRAAFRRDENYSWESDFDSEEPVVEPARPEIEIEQLDFGSEPLEPTAVPVQPKVYVPAPRRSYQAAYWALALVSALGVAWVLIRDLPWPARESPEALAVAADSPDRVPSANAGTQPSVDPPAPLVTPPAPSSIDTPRPTVPPATPPNTNRLPGPPPAAAKPAPPQPSAAVQGRTPAEDSRRPLDGQRRAAETPRPVEPPLSQRFVGTQRPGDTPRVPAGEPPRPVETPRPSAAAPGSDRAGLAPPVATPSVPAQPLPDRSTASERAPLPETAPPPRVAAEPPTQPAAPPPVNEPVNRPATPPRETAAAVPPPAAPPAAAPPSAASANAAAVEVERGAIRDVLGRYRNAFNSLDATAAHQVWPTVNQRTLDRAFGQLREQDISFDACSIDVNGVAAQANCTGLARFVPKVGKGSQQVESRQWNFSLRKNSSGGWLIQEVQAR